MKNNKVTPQYTGSCYIGVVGGDNEIGECRDSIEGLQRRNGDTPPLPIRATKGYEARGLHLDRWYNQTQHSFMLLLDHDMRFEPDTLERLRSHKLPYVSGYYLRRRYAPIAPVWFEKGKPGEWPMKPWTGDPERGKLHELGASGWGCIFIHRKVIADMLPLLEGELPILEDDMDLWPYDLGAIMGAIKALRTLTKEKPSPSTLWPAMNEHVTTLEKQIRPLRAVKTPVGSDIRFPFFAAMAGYTLMGDPDVRPAHMLNYPLTPDDYSQTPAETIQKQSEQIQAGVQPERKLIRDARRALK